MSELTNKSLTELVSLIKTKELKSEDITKDFIDNCNKGEKLNAFVTNAFDHALDKAKNFDKNPNLDCLLPGIPLAVKDLFCTEGVRTTAGSKMLENFIPNYESTVTNNLWSEGAFLLGKLNCDEFAMGSSNETSYFGNVINPLKDNVVPGGSSGGSAAAVCANLTPATIGTDTGGSIRQPASFTGTVGLKPTYGLCSRWGIVAFASSLDQAGPMTKNVSDCALMLEAMVGFDPKDSTSINKKKENYSKNLSKDIKGLKIGIPKEYRVDGMPSQIEELWDKGKKILKEEGAEIIDISLPHTEYALPTYYIVAPAEASSNLARYDGVKYGFRSSKGANLIEMYENTRSEGFGDEVKRRILIGTYSSLQQRLLPRYRKLVVRACVYYYQSRFKFDMSGSSPYSTSRDVRTSASSPYPIAQSAWYNKYCNESSSEISSGVNEIMEKSSITLASAWFNFLYFSPIRSSSSRAIAV